MQSYCRRELVTYFIVDNIFNENYKKQAEELKEGDNPDEGEQSEGNKSILNEGNSGKTMTFEKIYKLNCEATSGHYKGICETLKSNHELYEPFRVGCTFGVLGINKVPQPIFLCKTCNIEDSFVCYSCSKFCHAGHELIPASEDLWIDSSCECGRGAFNKCATLNDKNPV